MKLSDKEANILACIELRGNIAIEQIRKETSYRDHSIRYCLKRLQERGIIKKTPFINISVLGYGMHNLFFSIGSENNRVKNQLINTLKNTPQVLWLAEMGADYQYGLGICARQVHEIRTLLHTITNKLGNVFFEKTISSQFHTSLLPRGYLSTKTFSQEPVSSFAVHDPIKIDELDHKILSALVTYGNKSRRAIAKEIDVPLSSLELRVKKLEEKKVITGYVYRVDAHLFGMQSYKFLLFSKGVNPKFRDALYEFAVKHKHTMLFVECFGSWDYELNVEVEHQEDAVKVAQELYDFAGPDLQTVKVLSKFRDLKMVTFPDFTTFDKAYQT